MGQKPIHRRPQHQLPQQERTFQQAQGDAAQPSRGDRLGSGLLIVLAAQNQEFASDAALLSR
jgi:hypothetical protein